MVPAETGENEVVYCESGKYAANIEKATSRGPLLPTPAVSTGAAPEKFPTPGVVTIEALAAAPYHVVAHQQIKTLVYITDSKPILVLLRGDDQLNEAKLMARTGAVQVRPATPEECVATLGAKPGSLGALKATLKAEARVYADLALKGAAGMTTGANEDGFHFRHVDIERDLAVAEWADFRTVLAGELDLETGQPLKIRRAIEVGHVFKLGTKYSEKMNALYLDEGGKQHACVMGCYGIGVTRTLQAIIEQGNDKDGILWPLTTAPYTVCLTPLSVAADSAVMKLAEQVYAELAAKGVEVILDDRDERPGVKFKDADLLGFPMRVNLGEKALARGEVELKPRGGNLACVKAADAVQAILDWLAAEQTRLAQGVPAA
jgi:prolyl-tRNA synthetase